MTIDLTNSLKTYSAGWVAINKKTNKVVAHAQTFEALSKKVKGIKDVLFVPASKNYFGFVTSNA